MPLILPPGGSLETFFGNDRVRFHRCSGLWNCREGYSQRTGTLWAEGFRGVHGHRPGTGMGSVFLAVLKNAWGTYPQIEKRNFVLCSWCFVLEC
jgi:hypothetical protein